ncbi:alpha/beta hydrolase-fold protein [Kitasatospora sp. NPDC050543]|uniref:alpha/beta hydrolase-fold protein n=1 Tax=Kitasatospora sp. NPDC050543 TaxID=3364054 RepID=UPI0037BBF611
MKAHACTLARRCVLPSCQVSAAVGMMAFRLRLTPSLPLLPEGCVRGARRGPGGRRDSGSRTPRLPAPATARRRQRRERRRGSRSAGSAAIARIIDANLRTLADKGHRAVVGLSMGGYGALHYGEARPDLFGHVASLSGGIDLGMAEIRAAVLATELNITGAWCAVSTSSPAGTGRCTGYGPYVDSDAIFGSPYPVFNADHVWNELNPAAPANLARLAGADVTLYTGNQLPIDHFTEIASKNVKARLDGLGLRRRLVDYGNGSVLAPSCDGGHNYGCWAPAIADYIPQLQAAFAAAG